MQPLAGKVAIVTGAEAGIGQGGFLSGPGPRIAKEA